MTLWVNESDPAVGQPVGADNSRSVGIRKSSRGRAEFTCQVGARFEPHRQPECVAGPNRVIRYVSQSRQDWARLRTEGVFLFAA